MRTITAAQQAVLDSGNQSEHIRVSIKDASGVFRDLTTYPGFNAVKTVTWSEQVDGPHMTFDVVLLREFGRLSLSPYLQASAINRAFNPSGSFAPLIALTREVKIEVAIVRMDSLPSSGDWVEFFRGRIDEFDDASSANVKIGGRGLAGRLAQQFIKTEYVYSFASVGGVSKPLRIWEPQIPVVLNTTYCLPASRGAAAGATPADSGYNKFFICSQSGTTGTSEPTWTTGTNISDGTAKWDYVGAPTSAGNPVEQIMQNILTDHKSAGDAAVTLYTPSTPGWAIRQFIQAREFVLDAITKLAKQIGWDLRYKWRAATSQFELTLAAPNRAAPSVSFTFTAADYENPTQLTVNIANIRNSWRIVYSDRTDLWPDGSAKRKVIEVSDATSIAKYGELWAEIQEEENSQVDTSAEATALVTAALSDCKEPTAELAIPLVRGFPWVELNDYYTFNADNLLYDNNQSLAVVGWTQSYEAGARLKTTLEVRGLPTIGARRWLASSEHPLNVHERLPHQLVHYNGPVTQTAALTSEVGGQSIKLAQSLTDKNRIPTNDAELHIYIAPGTTLGTGTLKTVLKGDGAKTVSDLVPGKTYYGRLVARYYNHQKIIRGQPGAEFSFVAGRAQSGHYDTSSTPGLLPLNGNFEHMTDQSLSPPDHWEVPLDNEFGDSELNAWGEDGGVWYDTEATKGNFLYLYNGGNNVRGIVRSSRFPIRRGAYDVNFYISIRKDASDSDPLNDLHMRVDMYSTFGGSIIETTTYDFSAAAGGAHPTPGTWYNLAFAMEPGLLPINAAANFIRLTFYRGNASPDDFGAVRWDIGDVFVETTGQFSGRYIGNLTVGGTLWAGSDLITDGHADFFGTVDFQDEINFNNVPIVNFAPQTLTHVRAKTATAGSYANGATVVWATEDYDTLGEFVHTTGIFTATVAGKYLISAGALTGNIAWVQYNSFALSVHKNGAAVAQGVRAWAPFTASFYQSSVVQTAVQLGVGDTLQVVITHDRGGGNVSLLTATEFNYISIDRIF